MELQAWVVEGVVVVPGEETCRLDDVTRLVIVDNRHASRIGIAGDLLGKKGLVVHIYDHHPRTRWDIKADKDVFKEVGATVSLLLEILAKDRKPLSDLIGDIPKTETTPEIRVSCPDDKKFKVVEKVRDHFNKSQEVIDIDGARVLFQEGWGLVRASNTGPILVLRFEAKDASSLKAIQNEVESKVNQFLGET